MAQRNTQWVTKSKELRGGFHWLLGRLVAQYDDGVARATSFVVRREQVLPRWAGSPGPTSPWRSEPRTGSPNARNKVSRLLVRGRSLRVCDRVEVIEEAPARPGDGT